MGVTIHQGAVVGATASVYKDVESWTILRGNPAKLLKQRIIKTDSNMENIRTGGEILLFEISKGSNNFDADYRQGRRMAA